MKGNLYLIPSLLADVPADNVIPAKVTDIINRIDFYIVENERTARRYLKKLGIKKSIDELTFYLLNKYTEPDVIDSFLEPAKEKHIGLLSEAGAPGVADPGADIVRIAHKKGIQVVPLSGPSSIVLAMMASGLNGQNFAFNGYLPVKSSDRIRRIKYYEKISKSENQTQVFIETPYRNNQLFDDLVKTCMPSTLLSISAELTGENEFISTKTISDWKRQKPNLHKRPAIFAFQAG